MTVTGKQGNVAKPDVEAIIAEIRDTVRTGGGDADGCDDCNQTGAEVDLWANLDAANRKCFVGRVHNTGPVGLLRRIAHKVIGSLIGQINDFNSRVVRVLNRVASELENGRADGVRMQDQIERIEERVRRLEESSGKSR